MCSVACRNYCQFHLSLYGSSNYVLFVLNSLEMHVIYIYVCSVVALPRTYWWLGMLQIGIRAKLKTRYVWVALPDSGVGGRGCYKLVSEPWFQH
jgi:hypothetical protein